MILCSINNSYLHIIYFSTVKQTLGETRSALDEMRVELRQITTLKDLLAELNTSINEELENVTKASGLVHYDLEEVEKVLSDFQISASDELTQISDKLDPIKQFQRDIQIEISKLATIAERQKQDQDSSHNSILFKQQNILDDLEKLLELASKQLTVAKSVQKDVMIGGGVEKILLDQSQAIVDQILSEAHLTRDVLYRLKPRGYQPIKKLQTCDFFVKRFNESVDSGLNQCSRAWYLSRTYVKGRVYFGKGRKLFVYVAHGISPRVVGLEIGAKVDVKVTVKVMDQNNEGSCLDVGQDVWAIDEGEVYSFCDGWGLGEGCQLGAVNCDDLFRRKLVWADRLLLRYQIEYEEMQ